MKRFIYLIILFVLFLSGCQKEPMIRLSEERQAALSIEQAKDKELNAEEQANDLVFNPEKFLSYTDDMVFEDISAFIPIQPNQVHIFNENGILSKQYLDYVDSTAKIMQVREEIEETMTTVYYAWGTEQIIQLKSEQSNQLPINHIASSTSSPESRLLLLQTPLQKGNEWTVNDQLNATITNLYEEIQLNGSTINDVIEVTYQSNEGETIYYYAKGLGLVAITYPQGNKLLIETQIDVHFEKAFDIYLPEMVNNTLQLRQENIQLAWQTNDQLNQIYTALFQTLGWINQDIQVNAIYVNGDTLIADFSSGVVSAFNIHPAQEEGIIPALVTTLGKHFGVEKIQLTVNGVGLLPDRLSYPVGGVWLVNEELIVNTNESSEMQLTETDLDSESIEETTIENQ